MMPSNVTLKFKKIFLEEMMAFQLTKKSLMTHTKIAQLTAMKMKREKLMAMIWKAMMMMTVMMMLLM